MTGFSKVTSLFQFNKLLGFHICLPVYFMITLKGTDLFGPSLIHCYFKFLVRIPAPNTDSHLYHLAAIALK